MVPLCGQLECSICVVGWSGQVSCNGHSVRWIRMITPWCMLEWTCDADLSSYFVKKNGVVALWYGSERLLFDVSWSSYDVGWSDSPVVWVRLLIIWFWLKWSLWSIGWSACSVRAVGVVTLWGDWSSHSERGIAVVPFALQSSVYLSLQPHSLLWPANTHSIF